MNNILIVNFSTLNQIVNIIPIHHIIEKSNNEEIEVLNVTQYKIENQRKDESQNKYQFSNFDNKVWDDNLKKYIDNKIKCLSEMEELNILDNKRPIPPSGITINLIKDRIEEKIEEIVNDFEKVKTEIIINITGGQRNYIIAAYEVAKNLLKENYDIKTIYLEGHSGYIEYYRNNEIEKKEKYSLPKRFKLEDALNIMGFSAKIAYNDNSKEKNYYRFNKKNINEQEIDLSKIIDLNDMDYYKLLGLNKKTNKSTFTEDYKKELIDVIRKKLYSIKSKKRLGENKIENIFQKYFYKDDSNSLKNTSAYGSFFEKIIVDKLRDCIQRKNIDIIEMAWNLNTNHLENNSGGAKCFEHDICLLTNTGKIIAIECKTGSSHSDTFKSRKATAYMVGGPYALPILITPLKSEAIKLENKNAFFKKYFKEKSDDEKHINQLNFDKIYATRNRALRAKMSIWGADENFGDNLKNHLENHTDYGR